jgi:peptidoglycan/LPS O-acetylase OafA/YrhL
MKITYRPEIDGLRTIAVVAVIFYHTQISILGYQPFQGGFIGVDIFFVIYGYLITSIILKELVTTGSFSVKNFYERRIRRILPVLILVILISFTFAWIYLSPSSLIDFSKSVIYSIGFSSNFYFHYSGQEYGATDGLFKPLLHTWSLSVEEQFYILFPIVLLIIFKYFRRYIGFFLFLGFIISLGLSEWGSRNHSSFNFYTLPTRGWELLAGSILAYSEITLGHRSKQKILNLILPSIGLFLIGHSILVFNNNTFHPSFYTLSPIIGVCLIIWFSNKNEFITRILSSRLLVGIGLISYSLYLWHYPIFAFSRITEFTQESTSNKILVGLIVLILSIISYYGIEKPFRNKKISFRSILFLISFSFLILIISSSNIILKEGYKNRWPTILTENLELNWELLKNSEGEMCYEQGCKFNTSSKRKIFIVGDSQLTNLIFDLKHRVVKEDYQFITITKDNCFYFPGFDKFFFKTNKLSKACNNYYFAKVKEILSKQDNAIIIFGGRFPVYLNNSWFDNQEGGIERTNTFDQYNAVDAVGKYISVDGSGSIQDSFKNESLELSQKNQVILIYPIPEVGVDPNKKIYLQWINKKNKISNSFDLIDVTTSYQVYKDRTKSSFELLDSITNENIYRIYPHQLFCNTRIKDRCITHDDKSTFYRDSSHLSNKGAEMLNDLIMKEIKKIELKSN